MTRRVAPSILSADFGRLREQVDEVVDAGARVIHVDVMDGHFVPPITMGPGVVEALRDTRTLTLDVHLMIEQPERQIEAFAEAGADHITIHAEATPHVHDTLQRDPRARLPRRGWRSARARRRRCSRRSRSTSRCA